MAAGDDVAQRAINNGQSVLNSFDPTATTNKQLGQFQNLWGTQQGQTNDYIKQYTDTIKANPSVTDLYTQGNTQYNVPGLARTANYLQNQVTNALPSAYSAARGTDIGNAQIQNGVAQRLQYLQPQSQAATTNLQTAQNLAQGYVQAGLQQNEFNLLPIQAQGQFLSDAFARQQSGFTTVAQNELDGLKAKVAAGIQLTQAEIDRANSLTQAEATYNAARVQADAQIKAAQIGQQYQTLNPSQTLVNTFTGQSQRAR